MAHQPTTLFTDISTSSFLLVRTQKFCEKIKLRLLSWKREFWLFFMNSLTQRGYCFVIINPLAIRKTTEGCQDTLCLVITNGGGANSSLPRNGTDAQHIFTSCAGCMQPSCV